MGKRTTSRRLAMQILYQMDVSGTPYEAAFESVTSDDKFIDETKEFAARLVKGVIDNKKAVDAAISEYSRDWSVDRMSAVDKNIMRVAVFELRFSEETPHAAVINEAVELAKKYSGEGSFKFINGILGAVEKHV